MPFHADFRGITQRKPFDEFADIGDFNGFPHSFHVRVFVLDGDVGKNRVGEDETILHDDSALRTPIAAAVAGQIPSAQKHFTRNRRIEP